MWIQDINDFQKGTLIDVRSREEYDLNHVPGSINIPWDQHLYYLEDLVGLSRPLIFFCEEGYRSGLVVQSLRNLGFRHVFNAGRWIDVASEMEESAATAA
jgi:phage shock protein E